MQKKYYKIEQNILNIFQHSKDSKGVTLIELLIAMTVGLIVLGAIYAVFIAQNKQLHKQDQIAEMQQNARMAMDMMTKEIMMAGYLPTSCSCSLCTGTTPSSEPTSSPYSCMGIVSANAHFISFSSYTSGTVPTPPTLCGTVTPSDNVTYKLSSGVLGRNINGGGSQPVIENVSALTFTYVDKNGNVTTNLADIRRINISITTRTANIDPNTGTYHEYTLTSYVNLRNMGLPLIE